MDINHRAAYSQLTVEERKQWAELQRELLKLVKIGNDRFEEKSIKTMGRPQ
jgi:hypothetical protein